MGGSVTVAIRLSDGTAVCQDHWTNPTGYWLKRPALYESDAGAREYLAEYAALENDRDGYGRPVRLANGEYGMIVIDYVTNVILENNGYTDLGMLSAIKAKMGDRQNPLLECAAAGRLRLRTIEYRKAEPQWEVVSDVTGPNLPEREALNEIRRINGLPGMMESVDLLGAQVMREFVIDTAPFTIERFPEGETKAIRARLAEIGFPMTRRQGLNAG